MKFRRVRQATEYPDSPWSYININPEHVVYFSDTGKEYVSVCLSNGDMKHLDKSERDWLKALVEVDS